MEYSIEDRAQSALANGLLLLGLVIVIGSTARDRPLMTILIDSIALTSLEDESSR
jgi:hypothetical protein